MKIEFEFKELDGKSISEEKKKLLISVLDISDETKLESEINKITMASLSEYIEMLAGKGMPNRADESKQDRLFYLIKKLYIRIPSEDEISNIFQLTTTQSKTLLRNTLSRYRTKLQEELHDTLEETFKASKKGKNGWDITIYSEIIVEQFNLIIAKEGAEFNPIRKKSVGSKKYYITDDTYRILGDRFGK